jgi:hypothetical protein
VKIVAPARPPSVKRHWIWARYCLKQLHPACGLRYRGEPFQSLREILRVKPHRDSPPVTYLKLTGVSHNLGVSAQKAAGFRSELMCGDLSKIFDGHELVEHEARVKAAEQQRWIATLNIS